MSKIVLNDTAGGFNIATVNDNFEKIADTLQDKVLYRDNPSGEPNTMEGILDMNGNAIINVGNLTPSGDLIDSSGITFLQDGVGAIVRTMQSKLRETVSVKDFGAVGTYNEVANTAADTAAFLAALATGKNVYIPAGYYWVNTTLVVDAYQTMYGDSRANTYIMYTGSNYAIQMGAEGINGHNNIELKNFYVSCTNTVTPVIAGVAVLNCFYFTLEGMEIAGPFSPNSIPLLPLQGYGLYLTSNSIIGRVTQVSARQWEYGYYLKTLPASQSHWTAAISFDGQGEIASNMIGIVVGDPTVPLFTGVGCTFRNLAIQGNYAGGIKLNTGDNIIMEGLYWEGNANYDLQIGANDGAASPLPYGTRVLNSTMSTDGLMDVENPFTYAPYTAHIDLKRGIGTTISNNTLVYSDATPLIIVRAGATETVIEKNRLSNTSPPGQRCTNLGVNTQFVNNYPESPNQGTVKVGTLSRLMSAADGIVSYTGLGFKPSSITFTSAIDTVNESCVGVSDGTTTSSVSRDSVGAQTVTPYAVYITRPTSADVSRASVVSFDADGFTLAWSKLGTPPGNSIAVTYLATR